MYGEHTYLGSRHDNNIFASKALSNLLNKARTRGYIIKYMGASVYIESFFAVVRLEVQDCVLSH